GHHDSADLVAEDDRAVFAQCGSKTARGIELEAEGAWLGKIVDDDVLLDAVGEAGELKACIAAGQLVAGSCTFGLHLLRLGAEQFGGDPSTIGREAQRFLTKTLGQAYVEGVGTVAETAVVQLFEALLYRPPLAFGVAVVDRAPVEPGFELAA